MTRGWSSQDLPIACRDEFTWTVADAAEIMGPAPGDPPDLPPQAVRTKLRILARFHLTPVGKARTSPPGHPGRYARVYDAQDFIDLYELMGNRQAPPAAA